MLGEASHVVLAPNPGAVYVHVEDAARAFDEFRLNVELALDRIRQTGGCGEVVSFSAVLDGDLHPAISCELQHAL